MTPTPQPNKGYEMSTSSTFRNKYDNHHHHSRRANNDNNAMLTQHQRSNGNNANNANNNTNNTINSFPQKRRSVRNRAFFRKERTCMFHPPPSDDVDYHDNDTVFGRILRGEAPARILSESRNLLAFHDIEPQAPLHGLIIPKRYIPNIVALTPHDVPLLLEMYDMALQVLQQHHPHAFQTKDYVLCFHIPPVTSVDHLHLHVLAPASEIQLEYKMLKYTPESRWCTSLDQVLSRLQTGQSSSPYFSLPPIHHDFCNDEDMEYENGGE